MTYQYSVLVAGSGETSRANVEALIEDHYHANGKNGLVIVAFTNRPSPGQIWAAQLAASKDLDVVVVSPEHGVLDALGKANRVKSDNPFATAVELAKTKAENPQAFILWSDDDPDSVECLAHCKAHLVLALDLRQGLMEIQPAADLEPSTPPVIPDIELLPENPPTVDLEAIEDESEDEIEEDEDEESDTSDIIYEGIYAIAELIADMVAERLRADKE